MNTKTFQKKQKRKRLILKSRMKAKYEKKIEVKFLDGNIIKLKQGMANAFKKRFPMPDKNIDQNIDYGPRKEIEKAAPETGPLAPEKAEVINNVINTPK